MVLLDSGILEAFHRSEIMSLFERFAFVVTKGETLLTA